MSGEPGSKRGKAKRRNRGNRGRGSRQSQSESIQGEPQHREHREEQAHEINTASAQDVHQPSQQEETQRLPPGRQENVGEATSTFTSATQSRGKQKSQKQTTKEKFDSTQTSGKLEHVSQDLQAPKQQMVTEGRPKVSTSPLDSANRPTVTGEQSNITEHHSNASSQPRIPTPSSKSFTTSTVQEQQPGPGSKPQPHPLPTITTSATTSSLHHSEKAGPRPPGRPDSGGTLGRRIKLRVNFLPVNLPKNDIHHYHTEILAKGFEEGKGFTKKEAPMIIKCMVDQYQKANPHGPKLVYDKTGKNVYCKSPIPGIESSREYHVLFTTDNGKAREYTVTIKWVSKVSLHELNEALKGNRGTNIPNDTIQAIVVVLHHLPNMTSIPVGSSFFSSEPDGGEKDLGFGVEVCKGTFMSIRPTQWKMMMINIDTISTVFYKEQSVLAFLCECLKLTDPPDRLNRGQVDMFAEEITNLKIETSYIKRKQRVSGVSANSARNETFECEGAQVSVFDYFKRKYNSTLQYPDLPCLKLGQNASSCIPLELCSIMKGQRKQSKKLTPQQLQTMIKHTALPAPERRELINDLIRKAKFNDDEFLRDFGITVGQDMSRIEGRVLEPPAIQYAGEKKEMPCNGKWNMQHISYKTVDLNEWAIVSYENQRFLNDAGLERFVASLVQAGKAKGLSIHASPCYRRYLRAPGEIESIFQDLSHRYPDLQLLIVILPEKPDRGIRSLDVYYQAVKYYGDIIHGTRTQVIKSNTATRKASDKQTMANICLKINAKLGGTTFVLDKASRSEILRSPVIIFGADVSHPSPGDTTSPSIAAVVASMDSHPNRYSAEVRVQEHRKEIIVELKDIVKILLKKFKDATGKPPGKIIFYRDGVSEGQFTTVLIEELRAIQLACLELHEKFKPAITFIVVKKRHHTRFFPEDRRDQSGRGKNIPPGTVVDTAVCHPSEFDFYLCSHEGIQGTSKPAHYHVLYDDSNFTSDQLQTLSNQLCHTYVRCARAVSIPAPPYYAHHVAFRARYHLSEVKRGRSGGSMSRSGRVSLSHDEMMRAVKIHETMANTMYFA